MRWCPEWDSNPQNLDFESSMYTNSIIWAYVNGGAGRIRTYVLINVAASATCLQPHYKCDFYTTAKSRSLWQPVEPSAALCPWRFSVSIRALIYCPQCRYLLNYLRCWCTRWESNPHAARASVSKTEVSTCSTTRAYVSRQFFMNFYRALPTELIPPCGEDTGIEPMTPGSSSIIIKK